MNLKQLEAFLLVAELRNFTRAAGQLGMSQPAVSFQIKALEEELQVTLLERTEKKVVLTEAGRLLYPEARQMLRHYRKIRAVVDELRGLKSGHLILGATGVPGECFLPVFIGAFREQYPGVRVTLRVGSNTVIVRWLQEREIDLGILGTTAAGEGIRYHPWLEEQLIFIVPGWHPLAGKQADLEEITREPLLIREKDSGARQIMESKLAEHNISLQDFPSVLELGSSQAIIKAVDAGLGAGMVSRRAAADARAAGRVKELTVPGWQLKQTFYLAWAVQQPVNNLTLNTFREFIQDRDICRRLLNG